MSAIVVAVGSMREPKVEAVRRALARLRPVAADLAGASVIARDVADVSPLMPVDVVDVAAGERDVRSRQGAWGLLTRGLIERAFSFEVALLNAFAPFYNPEAYS